MEELVLADRPVWLLLTIAVVAIAFGAIHFRPAELPGLAVVGVVFGVCAWRTDRLGLPIVTHVAFNATGVVLAL